MRICTRLLPALILFCGGTASSQDTGDQIDQDIAFFEEEYDARNEESPEAQAVFDRIRASPASYIARVNDRLRHPTTSEQLLSDSVQVEYRALLNVANVASTEEWVRLTLESIEVLGEAYDGLVRTALSPDRTDPNPLETEAAAGTAAARINEGLLSLAAVEDSSAIAFAQDRWADPAFRRTIRAYLSTFGIDLDTIGLPLLSGAVPIVECVDRAPETPVVELGYANLDGVRGRVPYGPENVIPPPAYVPLQPLVFQAFETGFLWAGRSPAYPENPFRAYLSGADSLSWSLLGTTVSTAGAPDCSSYLPDWASIERLPAPLVVVGPVDATFRGTAFLISGAPHDASGLAIGVPTVPAVLASSPSGADDITGALSVQQQDRLESPPSGSAVSSSALRFNAETWASELSGRTDVTLTGPVPGTVGSVSNPTVAHAPEGIRLSGGFRGAGVLVVDGTFEMRGDAEWVGLVIVRGSAVQDVNSDVVGAARVVGGLITVGTETAAAELSLSGNVSVLYSPEALALARRAALGQ